MKRENIPFQLQNQGDYSWWMTTKIEVKRQNQEVLEFRRNTTVTNMMRPFQEATHHLTEYH